jgi:hypothetical protein
MAHEASNAQLRVALGEETGGMCRRANSSHDVRGDHMLSRLQIGEWSGPGHGLEADRVDATCQRFD